MHRNRLTSAYNSYSARLIHTGFSGRHFECVHDAALIIADGNIGGIGKLKLRLKAITLGLVWRPLSIIIHYCKAHIDRTKRLGQSSVVLATFD
jgi:hypothetical protein